MLCCQMIKVLPVTRHIAESRSITRFWNFQAQNATTQVSLFMTRGALYGVNRFIMLSMFSLVRFTDTLTHFLITIIAWLGGEHVCLSRVNETEVEKISAPSLTSDWPAVTTLTEPHRPRNTI